MRHALGVLGVLAAGVLLAVSATMNWRFGLSLGRTEFDGQIYGAASAAADCLKALVPFFLFAAIRNRMWSQALASALVWVVVVGFSLTAAVGHSALNRKDSAGQRTVKAEAYKEMRADLKRAQSQLGWIPQHRPTATVQSDILALKNGRRWQWTDGCTNATTTKSRKFCGGYHGLTAELASAQKATKLETRIAELNGKLNGASGAVLAGGDPQAEMLAGLLGAKLDHVQTGLTLLIALLLEIGSGLGMYIAFSQWRMYDMMVAPAVPAAATTPSLPEQPVVLAKAKPRAGANDNRKVKKLLAPETDVERFYKENVEIAGGSTLTATELYEDYCDWCDDQRKEPLALPTFGRDFGDLNQVKKARIGGRVRYIGIKLKGVARAKGDKNQPVPISRAA